MSAAPLLQARDLDVEQGGRCVLSQVSAAFAAGEWTAGGGPNGAGKSTLLAALAGLLRPRSGSVHLDGRPLGDWRPAERARRLAWLGQTSASDGDLAVREVVRLGRLADTGLLGKPSARDEAAVTAALEETAATAFAHRRLCELSGGERQRALLARAFAADTRVLLLDEPTVHLDAPHQLRLIHSLKRRARAGAAVVSVLHDLTLALAADRLLVLEEGRLRAAGAPGEAAVCAVLTAVFGHAFTIESCGDRAHPRLAAVPRL